MIQKIIRTHKYTEKGRLEFLAQLKYLRLGLMYYLLVPLIIYMRLCMYIDCSHLNYILFKGSLLYSFKYIEK